MKKLEMFEVQPYRVYEFGSLDEFKQYRDELIDLYNGDLSHVVIRINKFTTDLSKMFADSAIRVQALRIEMCYRDGEMDLNTIMNCDEMFKNSALEIPFSPFTHGKFFPVDLAFKYIEKDEK